MIYTVTFNPSIDYIVDVDHFQTGMVNRTTGEHVLPGGKGINVSIVLKNMGHESRALGFMAGFTGREIERLLAASQVESDFIDVAEGMSRINVKLRSDQESEINGQGPAIKASDIAKLYDKLDQLGEGDFLVLAGSIPDVMPASSYEDIMARLEGRGVHIVVDATRDLLVNVLKYHPFLIKPNNHELGEIFGVSLSTKEEVIPYAKKLQDMGAKNVMISMAGDGGLLITEDGQTYASMPPKGRIVNSVGAGDSMVAGFLTGYIETVDYENAFYMGLCTGSASAFSEELAKRNEVETLLRSLGR